MRGVATHCLLTAGECESHAPLCCIVTSRGRRSMPSAGSEQDIGEEVLGQAADDMGHA